MFESIDPAPLDPILGLNEAFGSDPRANKINLTVGQYQDSEGTTPILESVARAQHKRLEIESTKAYLGIAGLPEYAQCVQELVFGPDHEVIAQGRAATSQAPGGTGALRVAADFAKSVRPTARIWLSRPTWANHANVFTAAGLETVEYPYFDAQTNGLDLDAMLTGLKGIRAGDLVLLHGCCHNPTGIDPGPDDWDQIANAIYDRDGLPLVDFAYQGFAESIGGDAAGLRSLCRPGKELIVCSSFSKNFGLYRERAGALTVVASDAQTVQTVQSRIKQCIRANYSNPPAHGAAIVSTVLQDAALKSLWESEVQTMRERINQMRHLFVDTLASQGVDRDFSFITGQRGMFSFSGLSPQQVDQLREEHAIYVVRSGRINVAGMSPTNMDPLCSAIAQVLAAS